MLADAEHTGIKEAVLDEIRELARRYSVRRVVLFGSRARGDYWRGSDIDLAAEGGKIPEFALDVQDTTSTLLEFDIVDLSELPEGEFLHTIRREGIVIYEEV